MCILTHVFVKQTLLFLIVILMHNLQDPDDTQPVLLINKFRKKIFHHAEYGEHDIMIITIYQ